MPLFFWSNLFLEARAEILKKFRWFFGPNDDIKKSFWNWLTFKYAVDEAQTHAHNSAVAYCILLKTNKQKALELTLS